VAALARFIFNWLYARRNGGTMVLRLDDTDVERNTEASVNSIFDGLRWLGLDWDEEYKQSERLGLHRQIAESIFQKGLAYRDFTPAHTGDSEKSGAQQTWLFNPGVREFSRAESDAGPRPVSPLHCVFRVPRGTGESVRFADAVYGEQVKAADDIEDFALLRSDGMPTYHLASCADDVDCASATSSRPGSSFEYLQARSDFRGGGAERRRNSRICRCWSRPTDQKLSKRRHGPVVSVTTYRDADFFPRPSSISCACWDGRRKTIAKN